METPFECKDKKGVILLVDDEKTIIEVCTLMLKRLGYQVLEARDGLSALEVFEKNKDIVNVVILDMLMPGMNGATVYEYLKKMKPDVRVLLFSGYFENKQIQRLLENNNTDLIQKPIRLNHLAEKLKKILR